MAVITKEMIKDDLIELCIRIGDRHVGSHRNQRAVALRELIDELNRYL